MGRISGVRSKRSRKQPESVIFPDDAVKNESREKTLICASQQRKEIKQDTILQFFSLSRKNVRISAKETQWTKCATHVPQFKISHSQPD